MKRITLALFVTITFLSNTHAQSVMQTQEWDNLIKSLQSENWADANTQSLTLLNKRPNAESNDVDAAILRYMYIHSESGLMNLKKVTQDKAINAVKQFIGKFIVLPAYPITLNSNFNSIQMSNEKTDTLFISATNSQATDIFSFEYIVMDDKWSIDDFKNNEGKLYSLRGFIKSITVEGHVLPRFRIIIEHGSYRKNE